ncbi:hypothetical protein LTR37_015565 [Vermiconidia calcicola]|uniref:Uncharacterized protein n=1 Tax=Vermiconidia calcicola TaxID=1690605 RepID=A0ACC3MQH0_9PEZI|nr:hypothetical protein LTR37_015565 [Vermiconidia calcicola]
MATTFLSLPPELRTEIYFLTLPIGQQIDFSSIAPREIELETTFQWLQNFRSKVQHGLQQPPLTRVCRQIRDETLPIFYGWTYVSTNFTHFWVQHVTLDWLAAIGMRNRRLLKSVVARNLVERLECIDAQALMEWYRWKGSR